MNIETQNEQILNLLKQAPLTPLGALKLAGCMRLSARIYDLKDQGHDIQKEMVKVSSGKRVARYTLVKKRKPQTREG